MKLSCLQENLTQGLAVVGRAVASRTTLPVTQNVLMATDKSRLRLSATNLEIAITTWIGAMIEEEGSVTIPARLLTEFVNSLPSERIEMVDTSKPPGLNLVCGRFEARINGTDVEEFPPIPTVEEGVAVRISAQELRKVISRVVFAAATEESRPALTGVKLEIQEDRFTLAAADGFRLAVHDGRVAEPLSEAVDVIIPARALQEVNRFLGEEDEQVEMMVTSAKSQILFRLKDIELVSQLIQGTFPNYRPLIPESYQTRCVAPLEQYLQAARTAAIFARDGSGIIRLELLPGGEGTPGKLVISARAEEIGDHKGDIDATIEGEEGKIAFNSRYLIEVLSAMEKGDVSLDVTTPSSPGVFRMVGAEDYVHVVMPMFVQW